MRTRRDLDENGGTSISVRVRPRAIMFSVALSILMLGGVLNMSSNVSAAASGTITFQGGVDADYDAYWQGGTMIIHIHGSVPGYEAYFIVRLYNPSSGIVATWSYLWDGETVTYTLSPSAPTGTWRATLSWKDMNSNKGGLIATDYASVHTASGNGDYDGDGMLDGYEHWMGDHGSWQDMQVANRRYALLVYCDPATLPIDWYRNLVNSVYDDLIAKGYAAGDIYYYGFGGPQTNNRLDGDSTQANIGAGFATLATRITANDFFFLFWVGHGTQNVGFNIRLNPSETATYAGVQTWINGLNAKRMVLCFHPCFSGGVLPFVDGNNRVVISSASAAETNGGWGEVFRDGLLGNADNPNPDGNPGTVDSHGDGDGYVSLDEAYYYGAYRALALTGQHSRVEDFPANGDGGSFYTDATYDPNNAQRDGFFADHTYL